MTNCTFEYFTCTPVYGNGLTIFKFGSGRLGTNNRRNTKFLEQCGMRCSATFSVTTSPPFSSREHSQDLSAVLRVCLLVNLVISIRGVNVTGPVTFPATQVHQ